MRIASTPLAPIKPLNISEASDLAIAVKDISAAQTTGAVQEITAIKKPSTIVDSVNDPSMTDLADAANNSDTMQTKSDNVYFPINVNIPDNNTTPGTTAPLTEEEKRKRTILIASAVLLVLIVLVVIATRKK